MSTSVRWEGLEEFREWLRSLPGDAAGEAGHIVQGEANYATFQIRSRYRGKFSTGKMQSQVTVDKKVTRDGVVKWVVRNASPLAFIYEFGTEARHYYTVHGVKKLLGRMPPAHVFISIVIQRRRIMYLRLKDMLVRFGFNQVFGDG